MFKTLKKKSQKLLKFYIKRILLPPQIKKNVLHSHLSNLHLKMYQNKTIENNMI